MKELLKIAVILLLICLCNCASGQVNLVRNPSFEQYNNCPHFPHEVMFANYWTGIVDTGWDPAHFMDSFSASPIPAGYCLPTYFNECDDTIADPSRYCTVPVNGGFYQYPRTGGALMGARMYYDYSTPGFTFGNQQYIQGRLYAALIPGQSYCVTFYVNMAEASGYAINKIGAYLDDGTIDTTTDCGREQTTHTPQVFETAIIYDTLRWVKIQGSFVANGTERFITIGNFFDTAHTTHVLLHPGGYFAAYLVDDVSVIATGTNAYAGPDRYVATGDTATVGISGNGEGMPCYWYTLGGTTPIDSGGTLKRRVMGGTTYIVVMDLCGTITRDTVNVFDIGCAVVPVSLYTYIPKPLSGSTDTVNFTYTGHGSIDSVRWTFGDGNTSTVFNPMHVYTTPPDSFMVCLKIFGPCGSDTFCQWIHTCFVPEASFIDTGVQTFGFNYTGITASIDSIRWSFGDGSTSTVMNPTHTYSTPGTYHVCVKMYTSCGNDSACHDVVVSVVGVPLIGLAMTDVQIWPNPANSMLYIDNAKGSEILMYDMVGKKVHKEIISSDKEIMHIEFLPKGVYIIQIIDQVSGFKIARKLIKE